MRRLLMQRGIDGTGAARGPMGNGRIGNEQVDSTRLAEAIAATGISQDDRQPTVAFQRDGTASKADTSIAERFRAWQEVQARRSESEEQVRSALVNLAKERDALATLKGDVERKAAKQVRKRREAAVRSKSPALRESHALGKGIKVAKKHLVNGLDNESALNLAWISGIISTPTRRSWKNSAKR